MLFESYGVFTPLRLLLAVVKIESVCQWSWTVKTKVEHMKLNITSIISLSIPLLLPVSGSGAELGTRQQTICPVAIPTNTPQIFPNDVPDYAVYGYSAWQWGSGENEGQRLDLMTNGYTGATNAARLLSFFSLSDIHLTDKESPAQLSWFGWNSRFGAGGLFASAYSPIMRSTTSGSKA